MCILQICAQCSGKFFEVSPDETETAELMVEDMMSQLLLVFFNGGTIDEVTIAFSSGSRGDLLSCSIRIFAQCSCQDFAFFPCTMEQMQRTVEKSAEFLLRELFGSVRVEHVLLSPSANDSEHDPVLFSHR